MILSDDEIQYLLDGCHSSNTWTLVERTIAATVAKLAAGIPDLVDSAKDEHGHCIMCGIHPASVQAYLTTAIAAARVQALEDAAKVGDAKAKACLRLQNEPDSDNLTDVLMRHHAVAHETNARAIRALIGANHAE